MSRFTSEARGRLCIVTAAEIEFKHIVKALRPEALIGRELDTRQCRANLSGEHGQRSIVVLQSEMGAPDFASRLQRHLTIFPYDGLIVLGLAGALAPGLKAGDIVLYEQCLYASYGQPLQHEDFISYPCDTTFAFWVEKTLASRNLKAQRIQGLAVGEVITQASDKAVLHRLTQAAAVDMESGIVAKALHCHPMPMVMLRVIVDEAAQNLPAFNEGLRADGRYDAGKMLCLMAARPGDSVRFLWHLRRATQRLQAVTRALLIG